MYFSCYVCIWYFFLFRKKNIFLFGNTWVSKTCRVACPVNSFIFSIKNGIKYMKHFFYMKQLHFLPGYTGSPFLILQLSQKYFRILFAYVQELVALLKFHCKSDFFSLKRAEIHFEVDTDIFCISVAILTSFSCSLLWGGEKKVIFLKFSCSNGFDAEE